MRAILLAALCLPLWAGTQIIDTVKSPFSGQTFTGRVTIACPSMVEADGSSVLAFKQEYSIISGALSVTLEAQDTALQPVPVPPCTARFYPGTFVGSTFSPLAGDVAVQSWIEQWRIITSSSPLRRSDVLLPSGETPASIMVGLSQLLCPGCSIDEPLIWNGSSIVPGLNLVIQTLTGPTNIPASITYCNVGGTACVTINAPVTQANLATQIAPFFTYCPDCTVASCAGSGTGAYVFAGADGHLTCPF